MGAGYSATTNAAQTVNSNYTGGGSSVGGNVIFGSPFGASGNGGLTTTQYMIIGAVVLGAIFLFRR